MRMHCAVIGWSDTQAPYVLSSMSPGHKRYVLKCRSKLEQYYARTKSSILPDQRPRPYYTNYSHNLHAVLQTCAPEGIH